MARDLVSVVIPTYDRAYCLERAVDSVLTQSHAAVEVVVVDDGSRDGTTELVARRYGKDPRVRYLSQSNQGVSAARNRGLAAASGDYIALLDSDDVWFPWKLEAQLRVLEALPDAGMVWTDMTAVGPTGEVLFERYLLKMYSAYGWFSREELFERKFAFGAIAPNLAPRLGDPSVFGGDIFSPMVLGNLVHTSTVLLRRERWEKVRTFRLDLKRSGEDYDFHLRTCREGPVAYLDVPSILYQRGREDQLTVIPAYKIDMAKNFLATIAPVIERDRDRITLPRIMIDEVLAEAHAWIGQCHYDRGENRSAAAELAGSLWLKPHQPRVAAFLALSLLPPPVGASVRALVRRTKQLVRQSPLTRSAA
jgi:glycosyltransferase involved in cell wall biosynthesis